MRGKILGIIIAVIGVTVVGVSAAAHAAPQRFDTGETTTLAKGQMVDSAYYAAGNAVKIAGTVKGDVYCAGQSVTIDGTVDGDVMCAGQTVTINGTVNGDVRVAGQQLNLGGTISGSATLFGQNIAVEPSARIGRDLSGAGQSVTVDGAVARDVTIGANDMAVSGRIGRTLTSQVNSLQVMDGAAVKGSVYYTSDNQAAIAKGSVTGEVKRSEPDHTQRDHAAASARGFALYFFFAMLLVAMALVVIMPQTIHNVSENGLRRLGMSILTGFFVLVGVPFIVTLIGATLIGIPLAILILFGWFVVLMLSGPMFGYYLGRVILGRATNQPLIFMLFGSTILLLSYFVPLLGLLTVFAAGVVGSGMTVLELAKRYQKPSYTLAEKRGK